jgi:hypothetical protein
MAGWEQPFDVKERPAGAWCAAAGPMKTTLETHETHLRASLRVSEARYHLVGAHVRAGLAYLEGVCTTPE